MEGLREALKKGGGRLDTAGEAAMTEALAENGVEGSGALYEAGAWRTGLATDLRWAGTGLLALNVGVTFQGALDKAVAAGIERGWSGPEEWRRAGLRTGLEVGLGYSGAYLLGGAGALAAPPPWDLATGAVSAGTGAGIAEMWADARFTEVFGP